MAGFQTGRLVEAPDFQSGERASGPRRATSPKSRLQPWSAAATAIYAGLTGRPTSLVGAQHRCARLGEITLLAAFPCGAVSGAFLECAGSDMHQFCPTVQ
jgi:hypothetical protein